MGIQLIIEASVAEIETALGKVATECEIFQISPKIYGISLPGKVIDSEGEDWVRARLFGLKYFDLWEGKWNSPNPDPVAD